MNLNESSVWPKGQPSPIALPGTQVNQLTSHSHCPVFLDSELSPYFDVHYNGICSKSFCYNSVFSSIFFLPLKITVPIFCAASG